MSEPTVFQAMLARARADATLSGLAGGRVLDHVPATLRDAGTSCLVLVHGGNQPPDYTTESDYVEAGRYEWHCYGRGSLAAEEMALRVQRQFDPGLVNGAMVFAGLDIDGMGVVSVLRVGYQVQPEAVTLDGEVRNRAVVPYDVVVTRAAPTRES
jgi:hypothetical protein